MSDKIVDVIVPVYRGYDETCACLQSVFDSEPYNQTLINLIVIDDESPEPELSQRLKLWSAERGFTLLVNEQNVGFVATVNRGMSQTQNDVILLNSDTEVANNWVDRLVQHIDENVSTVTPFSNNATLCSYPMAFEENALPYSETVCRLDSYFSKVNAGMSVQVPTGVGFCMLITRQSLNTVGLFDEFAFGKGYGEENDFCQRAIKQGFSHLHALDIFVWHKGGVSFSGAAKALQENALAIMRTRYPDYEKTIQNYRDTDPARWFRLNVAIESIQQPALLILTNRFVNLSRAFAQYQKSAMPVMIIDGQPTERVSVVFSGTAHRAQLPVQAAEIPKLVELCQSLPVLNALLSSEVSETLVPLRNHFFSQTKGTLHIVNNTGGGTLRYVESLAQASDSKERHFILYMSANQQVLYDCLQDSYYPLYLKKFDEWSVAPVFSLLAKEVNQLGIHLHSMFGEGLAFSECLPENLPLVITFHDHYFLSDCAFESQTIIPRLPHIKRIQQLTQRATKIIVPSDYLLQQAKSYFALDKLCVIPHGTAVPAPTLRTVSTLLVDTLMVKAQWDKNKPTVAIVGAIGVHKGMRFMEKLLKRFRRDSIQWVHIGFTSQQQAPFAQHNRIQHGPYHHDEVPLLLKNYGADLVVFFPGIPESFCYALSDIYGTLPVLAPDIGAIGERVRKERLGTTYSSKISPRQLKKMIIERLKQPERVSPEFPELKQMVCDTEFYYAHVDGEDWAKQGLTETEMQCFFSENLNEDNLKLNMVYLARENYQLRQEVERLKQVKKISLLDDISEKVRHVIWRCRHYTSRMISYGPVKTAQILLKRLRGR